jgi:hypothetical protein
LYACTIGWYHGDKSRLRIPKSRLLPDAFGDRLNRGDDDDVVRGNFSSNDQLIADRHECKNFVDVLSELGEYTTVFDSISGHQDSLTHTDGALLENKSSFPQGDPDSSISLCNGTEGRVPPGALAYPKYKIATLSFALSDVELHCLDKDLHCSPRQMDQVGADRRSRRGAWIRHSDGTSLFYPGGFALLDWNSRNNHAGGPYHMKLRRSCRNKNNNTEV